MDIVVSECDISLQKWLERLPNKFKSTYTANKEYGKRLRRRIRWCRHLLDWENGRIVSASAKSPL